MKGTTEKKKVGKKKGLNLPIHYTPVYLSLSLVLVLFLLWRPHPSVLGVNTTSVEKVCTLPLSLFGKQFCLRSSTNVEEKHGEAIISTPTPQPPLHE